MHFIHSIEQNHKRSVAAVLFLDVITAILLAMFWNVTITINGHAWHVPLIALAFVGGVRLAAVFFSPSQSTSSSL